MCLHTEKIGRKYAIAYRQEMAFLHECNVVLLPKMTTNICNKDFGYTAILSSRNVTVNLQGVSVSHAQFPAIILDVDSISQFPLSHVKYMVYTSNLHQGCRSGTANCLLNVRARPCKIVHVGWGNPSRPS